MMLPFLLLQATTAPVTGTTPVTTSVATIGDSVRASLTVAFAMMFSAIPRVLGFIIILLVAGLAFGLGGRELAGSVLENWYGKAQAVKPKVERAASAAERMPPGR